MNKEWTSVRVTVPTLARINAEIQFLLRGYGEGRIKLPNAAEGFSHDALVNRLLDAVHQHRARARAQRQRRKGEEEGQP